MAIDVIVRQKRLFKKTLPLNVILGDRLLYGDFDGIRLIPDQIGADSFIAFDPEAIARGFSVVWTKNEKQTVSFRLPLPSTASEIRAFFDAVARVATYWRADVELDGTVMNIAAFSEKYDETLGFNERILRDMASELTQGEQRDWTLHAAMWPLVMGRDEAERFLQDPDAYGQWLHEKQAIDAYYAAPMFARTSNGVEGYYMLPCDALSVFPLVPHVPFGVVDPQTGKPLSCRTFYVVLSDVDAEEDMVKIPYSQFFERLDDRKTHEFDVGHFVLDPLSKQEMAELI